MRRRVVVAVSVLDLEEVIRRAAGDVGLSSSRRRVELKEGVLHVLIELHNSSLVTAAVAIVGRREDGDDRLLMAPVVTFHDKLMGTGDECESIGTIELFRHILTESVTSTTRRDTPSAAIIGIGPKQIAHRSLVRNLLETIQSTNTIESINERRQSSVKTEDAVLNQSSERQKVEQVRKHLPNVDSSILSQALIVESIAK